MILCDIGNSNIDFYHDGKIWSMGVEDFLKYKPKEKVFFISVNEHVSQNISQDHRFVDIQSLIELDTIYQGMGIDRVCACSIVDDGIVVDAGSAITVDIMSNGMHLGGYILPGIAAYEKCYSGISSALQKRVNPNVILDALPQKTEDAISYAVIKSILMMLEDTCKDKAIYFTGGDGKFLSKYFKNSIYDRSLIFRGMLKALKNSNDYEG